MCSSSVHVLFAGASPPLTASEKYGIMPGKFAPAENLCSYPSSNILLKIERGASRNQKGGENERSKTP
jgi:hypothetical protein